MRVITRSHIVGTCLTKLGVKSQISSSSLVMEALSGAIKDGGNLELSQIDGLIAVPSLAEPRFMEAHHIATKAGILPKRGVVVRTIDTGGAGPISGLLEADEMIRFQGCDLVAVVAGDAVSSLPTDVFLERADAGCMDPDGELVSPVIPHGYDRVARWQQEMGTVTRDQLAMVSVLMSRQAVRHPYALTKQPRTLDDVLSAPQIAPSTTLLECARRADGAAAILLASTRFMETHGLNLHRAPVVVSGGEASGPLFPPKEITREMFSCEAAAHAAYTGAHLGPEDIDHFSLYDCFPICFIRAVEAVGLAPKGGGGAWVEKMYRMSEARGGVLSPDLFPVNTHGGLLAFGAPWETPAMYNIIEAVAQINGEAGVRQVSDVKRALVYGNGGIFSASAVAILAAHRVGLPK